MCVHCHMKVRSQSKLFVRGGEGEVCGVGDCDALLHTILYCTAQRAVPLSPCRAQTSLVLAAMVPHLP